MQNSNEDPVELTYPLRAAARLTGLSPEVLRAWERRHQVVEPIRTPGGTRRYRAADLEKLRLVKAAVDAGHRIGRVARMDAAELKRTSSAEGSGLSAPLDAILASLDRLDHAAAQHLLSVQLAALGPVVFARQLALPLLREIGERWANGDMGIASEHLATGILRGLLGAALQPTASSLLGPRILFATPSGERHELGLLIAALTALGAGGNPLYLGAELPVEDMLRSAEETRAAAVALSIVTIPAAQVMRTVRALRGGLPDPVHLWLGGAGAENLQCPSGLETIASLDALVQRVTLLGLENGNGR
jgi:DNA-binding transcriptional MerR regulator